MSIKHNRRIPSLVFIIFFVVVSFATIAPAQVVHQVTDNKNTLTQAFPAMDDAGTVLYVNSSTNQLGDNPDHVTNLFSADPVTGALTRLTSFPEGISGTASVSDDGQWLSFHSLGNLTGQNHDHSPEVFVMMSDGTGLQQITSDPALNSSTAGEPVISGSGNRVVFTSNGDYLGTNSDRNAEIWIVDRNGTNLRQLTSGTASINYLFYQPISDDGQRIVFNSNGNYTGGNGDGSVEVFAVNFDGTGMRQLTSFAQPSFTPVLSGNGLVVAFASTSNPLGTNADGLSEIFSINYDGTNLRQLTNAFANSYNPSIRDDASIVYFESNQVKGTLNSDRNFEIWRVNANGTNVTPLTNTSSVSLRYAYVSGNGSRVAFYSYDGSVPWGSDPDRSGELQVMDSAGGNRRQLSDNQYGDIEYPDISYDGSRVAFVSTYDPLGTNAPRRYQVFYSQSDGSGLTQTTNLTDGDAYPVVIKGDGTKFVFGSGANPLGTNADHNYEIFTVNPNGTGLQQLTNSADTSDRPAISSDGSKIVFESYADFTGTEGGVFSKDCYSMNADGSGLTRLTTATLNKSCLRPRLDTTGTWAVFYCNSNLDGGNPDGGFEVFRIRSNGTGLQRITGDPVYEAEYPDISGNGDLIVFTWNADPLGTNLEHNEEIFLYQVSTATFRQLTQTYEGESVWPRISRNGSWVYFYSSSPFFEEDPDQYGGLYANFADAYRVSVATGLVERVTALRSASPLIDQSPAPDGDGDRAAYKDYADATGRNHDGSEEVFLIDRGAPASIYIGRALPTVVTWDVESGPLRYDVVRGQTANLIPGPSGTVDLGPVVCLEDNSTDASTERGFEDAVNPAPGQAFFYLYRGSQGLNAGPGSWGFGKDGSERVAGAGGCTP